MSEIGLPENARRILRFILQPSMWLITLIAIVGFLLGVQSKHPLPMDTLQPRVFEKPAEAGMQGLTIKPPIFHYGGPIVFSLQHGEFGEDISLSVASGGKKLSYTVLPASPAGSVRFYFFPGDFSPNTGVNLEFFGDGAAPIDSLFQSAEFTFPKVGAWLVPDILLWGGLLLTAICFGLICSLIWQTSANVIASYAGTVAMLILACHFGGIALAWRITNQLPAVLLLLVAVFLVRWLAIPAKPVVIR